MPSDAELREMLARATPGPWGRDEINSDYAKIGHCNIILAPDGMSIVADCMKDQDIDLVLAMHGAMPTLLDRIEVLEKALRPFAQVADVGKEGGAFVIAHAVYADMRKGVSAPRQSYWHWSDFQAARTAIEGGKP